MRANADMARAVVAWSAHASDARQAAYVASSYAHARAVEVHEQAASRHEAHRRQLLAWCQRIAA